MLTMVSAQNPAAGELLLPLLDSSGGYSVKDIEGLGPVKATLTSTTLATLDGARLNNKRREPRNIILTLGLETDWVTNTVAGLRRDLYKWFAPKSEIAFNLFEDDEPFGSTLAVVESCEPNMFTADPEVVISLMCFDPDIYGDVIEIDSSTVADETTQEIVYAGTTDAGIIFEMTFVENATSVILYNTRPDGNIQVLNLEGAFSTGDVLTINTIPGQRSATRNASGLVSSILSYLHTRSDWISLEQGSNLFRAYYNGTVTPFTLTYTNQYGGF